MFPRTRPDAFVSSLQDSSNTGIETIGELIDTSAPGSYIEDGSVYDYEPEFVYRIPLSDRERLGNVDSSGTMKAVKLSQVSALHFDAVLSEDLVVTNFVGIAGTSEHSPNGVYPAGTLLETIIIDMLTAGATVYDVAKMLPDVKIEAEYQKNGDNFNALSDGQTIEVVESDVIRIRYRFVFYDGKYIPVNGYDSSLFEQYNNIPDNSTYYDASGPFLWAGSSPNSLKFVNITDGSIQDIFNPVQNYDYTNILGDASAGTKVYEIRVDYTVAQSLPYKSNNTRSDCSIEAGTCDNRLRFIIRSAGAAVYDVYAQTPQELGTWSSPHIKGFMFNEEYPKSRIEARNRENVLYDGTNLWSGDDIEFALRRYYNSSLVIQEEIHGQDGGEDCSVFGPVFGLMECGRFLPLTGYPLSVFATNNHANYVNLYNGFVNADCRYSAPVEISLMKQGSNQPLRTVSLSYNNINMLKKKAVVKDDTIVSYYSVLENYVGPFLTYDNIPDGIYYLQARIPYSASNVIPKRSDNTNSSVNITAGELIINTDNITVRRDIDVIANSPTPTIHWMAFGLDASDAYDNHHYTNGETAPYSVLDSSFTLIAASLTTGDFRAEDSLIYTNAIFGDNNHNPGAVNGILDAACDFQNGLIFLWKDINTGYCETANVLMGLTNYPYIQVNDTDSILTQGANSFTLRGRHYGSSQRPKKFSTKYSTHLIGEESIQSADFILNVAPAQYYRLTITTSPYGTAGQIRTRIDGNSWTPWSYDYTYNDLQAGTSIEADVSVAPGYQFVEWESNEISSINHRTSYPIQFTAINGSAAVTAIFREILETDHHFILVDTTDPLGQQYSSVQDILSNARQIFFNDIISDSDFANNNFIKYCNYFGIGSNWNTFMIMAPVEYTRAAIYVNSNLQNVTYTVVPPIGDNNGLPYDTGGTIKYRIFAANGGSYAGYGINAIQLSKTGSLSPL